MNVYDAADVRTHGVDGGVRAEPGRVDPQGGGALLDHVPDDVHLHLRGRGQTDGQLICFGCMSRSSPGMFLIQFSLFM